MQTYFENVPNGLFEKIILAIKKERDLRQTRRILFSFLFLLIVSVSTIPASTTYFIDQWNSSRVSYFIAEFFNNFQNIGFLWQELTFSILESAPILAMTLFVFNLAVAVFTIRLFLYKKGYILGYFSHKN